MKNKIVAVTILLLVAFATIAPFGILAQSNRDVDILQVTPSSRNAASGTFASVTGTIYTYNGQYQVLLGKTVVASGTSEGYYVEANFTVPELPASTYALILRDVRTNVNASEQFTVTIGYSVTPNPSTVQEGESVTLNVAVTGGSLGTNYGANVAVVLPSGTTYRAAVTLGTPNGKGTASKQITFPSDSFSPSGAVTDYAGAYKLSFNDTLGSSQFSVNILDSNTYHRGQTVTIRAIGYQPNQAATITVTSGGETLDTKSVSANAEGVVSTTWVVSANAPIGECILRITPEGTQKSIQDKQTFTVIGYTVQVQVINLSDKAVPNILIKAVDTATDSEFEATTNSTGVAVFKLEKGPYDLTAFLKDLNVGQTSITVAADDTFTMRLQLTDLKIAVKTENGIAMPFVDLAISYRYQSGSISKSGNGTGQTDPSGSFLLASTLAGATYTIDASMYGRVFNTQNNTVSTPSNQATTEFTIVCPSRNVTLDVTGYSGEAIPNARIELVELSNGLFYSATTDISGSVTTQATFGTYRVRVYKDSTLVNEVRLEVFSDTEKQVRCSLYGIELTVSVVDFFGAPITNANVTLNGSTKTSAMTQGNGIATFSDIIGGDMQIIAQAQGTQEASQALVVNVNEPTTVQIKMEKYVSLGGMFMQTSTMITIIIILVLVAVFALVEVYRQRKIKPAPSAGALA